MISLFKKKKSSRHYAVEEPILIQTSTTKMEHVKEMPYGTHTNIYIKCNYVEFQLRLVFAITRWSKCLRELSLQFEFQEISITNEDHFIIQSF